MRLYRPTAQQQLYHDCMASETLVIGGNRSGKSLCSFVEDAYALTGTHPIKGKYPEKDGRLAVIGQNWKHCGLVIYPTLFRAGAFKIIRDLTTGLFRAYDPVLDAGRSEDEVKPAPPLIPPRLIKSMAWVNKASGYLSQCVLHNGWELNVFSSEGDPPQGFALNRCHIDEDLNSEIWIPEMQARLADRQGRFSWSAMPHSKNDALLGLSERADQEASLNKPAPLIQKFVLRFLDNPHILDIEKQKMLARWSAQGVDMVRQRSEGEFTLDSVQVYPSFSVWAHTISLENNAVPKNWTRYAVIDPGHAVLAVLFAAVPPDNDQIMLYDELYIRNANAEIFGQEFQAKFQQQPHGVEAFLIDAHGGRLTDIGSGRSPQTQYSEQLVARGIRSNQTGCSFIAGADDVMAGLQEVRSLLHIRPSGHPRLRLLKDKMPNLIREFQRYRKRTIYTAAGTQVTDQPRLHSESHLLDCVRYLAMYRPVYVPPRNTVIDPWWVKWAAKREKNKATVVNLSPASYSYTFDA